MSAPEAAELARGVCACGCGRVTQARWPNGAPAKHYPGHATASGDVCTVPSCDRKAERRTYCNAHDIRIRKHGDPQEHKPITVRRGFYVQKDGYIVVPARGHANAHKNGIRGDNRIENLELWSGRHPTGARVADQVRWATEVIARYGSRPEAWESA